MKKLLLNIIEIYQKLPFHAHSNCRYVPTCSQYAKIAIENYGAWTGTLLALKRIVRCNPFCKGGIDLVPEIKKEHI